MKLKIENMHNGWTTWIDREELQAAEPCRHNDGGFTFLNQYKDCGADDQWKIVDAELSIEKPKDLDWFSENFRGALHVEEAGRVLAFAHERSSMSGDVYHGTTYEFSFQLPAGNDEAAEWLEENRISLAEIVACLKVEWDGSNWRGQDFERLAEAFITGYQYGCDTWELDRMSDFPSLKIVDGDEWMAGYDESDDEYGDPEAGLRDAVDQGYWFDRSDVTDEVAR